MPSSPSTNSSTSAAARRLAVAVASLAGIAGIGAAPPAPAPGTASGSDLFIDVAAETGLDFVHFNGMSGEYYFSENMGQGAGLLDYDGDGDLDVWMVQGAMLGTKPITAARFPPKHPQPLSDRLYRNDLALAPDGSRTLRFTDVTAAAGLAAAATGYGMGIATGDYDNDGDVDVYRAVFGGADQLLRNDGGTFVDVASKAGVGERRWTVSAAFVDVDRDGWLDLYVATYVDFSLATHKYCASFTGARDYCGPLAFAPEPDRLYRNRGDGTFEDVTARALPNDLPGSGLGVATADFDGDGWLDVFVANDMRANQLWMNQKNGTFRDEALLAGCAANEDGQYEAGMGVDAGDFDNDGDEDVFITHLTQETNTLYRNDGKGFFEDWTDESGLGLPSWKYTGFGTAFFDYDNDSWLDLLTVNGTVKDQEELVRAKDPYPLDQEMQLFRNLGTGRFEEATARAGEIFKRAEVGRGAAFGDVDDDGDTDVLVANNAGPAWLLRNEVGAAKAWIGLRLVGGTAGGRPRPRHAGGAGRGLPARAAAALAPGAGRRQLRLGQRSAGARRPGRHHDGREGAGRLAERQGRGVDGPAGPGVHHLARGHGHGRPGPRGAEAMSVRAWMTGLLAMALATVGAGQGAGPALPAGGEEIFRDVAAEVGIDFVHFNGMSGELYYPEMNGAGVALLDYDGDGDLDVFLQQGAMLGGKPLDKALFPPKHPLPLTHRLYRNDLAVAPDGTRTLRFTDVTSKMALPMVGYAMGLASGDFDNDGRIDLYLSNFGPNQMLKNNGDGTFTDVTAKAGTDEPRWDVAASFFDYDRDGWLDLFVATYVNFTLATHKPCSGFAGMPDYCGPLAFLPEPDRLFRNRGDGTFADVTATALVAPENGSGLGVVAADLNGDGWSDLYVANDLMANDLWINQKDGTFRNEALLGGCAANEMGEYEASMGVDAADADNDGDDDLFMTHLTGQTNTFYLNDGRGMFKDWTQETGLGPPSWNFTGFGTTFFDYDNDSWLDLLVTNGEVRMIGALVRAKDPYPLHQTDQLFRNLGVRPDAGGRLRYEEVTAGAGQVFRLSEVGRGAAFGDVDNDGDTDVLVTNNNGPARLLRNEIGSRKPWLGLRLVGGTPGRERDMLGARAGLFRKGRPTLWRRAHTDGSYEAASDPRVLFGLGDGPGAADIEKVRVVWPSGRAEEFTGITAGAYTTLREGTGRPAP